MKKFNTLYEEMTLNLEVEVLSALFMSDNSIGQVQNHISNLI